MTETRKESLSALIDGEASEIEVHRLVREFRTDGSLTRSWAAYQHIRTTVQSDRGQPALGPVRHEALFQRITDAIDLEEAHERDSSTLSRSGSHKGIVGGSLALAASLVVAVFIGVSGNHTETGTPVAQTGSTGAPATVALTPQAVQSSPSVTYASTTSPSTSPVAAAPELIELDEEKQRRLRAYLNQHDRMARMNSNRQLVNYTEVKDK